ncbi:MAG: DUF1295 domain-containing protein [Bacteroidales bacterium]|nr:DUF1295 domain-containing protein [Bacteroidales bacterium]
MMIESALLVLIYMVLMYILAQILKDNSIVDIGWGLGFAIIAVYTYLDSLSISQESIPLRSTLVTALVLLWGLRLSIRIFLRNKGRGEDFRYRQMREGWGKYAWLHAFFKVFILQGAIMLVVALPVVAVNSYENTGLIWIDYLALLIYIIGFIFEAGGDWQLAGFKKHPENKGKLMTKGLWKFTRHPNYFGDAAIWWGFGIFGLTTGLWYVLISPVIMNLLLRYVSGVPLLEKKYDAENRRGWEEYKRRTPIFVPWIPKK